MENNSDRMETIRLAIEQTSSLIEERREALAALGLRLCGYAIQGVPLDVAEQFGRPCIGQIDDESYQYALVWLNGKADSLHITPEGVADLIKRQEAANEHA